MIMPQSNEALRSKAGSQPTSLPVVDVSGVVKTYGTLVALSGIDLRVFPGEIYGLLGPNGAGKSTLIKMIGGMLQPSAGSIRVIGKDLSTDSVRAKASIGYVPETSMLYDSLTPRDFFEFVASVRGVPGAVTSERVTKLVEAFDVGKYFDSPIGTLSMGTKQKVSIIASLLHEPRLLLFDEPLNGLDAKSSRILKDLISFHVEKNGGAVLFSTHIMEVAERLCTRLGIIYDGKIVAEGTMEQLRSLARDRSPSTGDEETTLEEVFLRLTNEEVEVEETVKTLREAFAGE